MAEFLAGASGHSSFAPLSHSQTVSIAKHLQDQISDIKSRFDEFISEYSHTKEEMQVMQKELRNDFEAVHDLQDGLASSNAIIDRTKQDLSRTNAIVSQLSGKLNESHNNDLKNLMDAQKHSELAMQKLHTEVDHCIDVGNRVRERLEKQINLEITQLKDDLKKTNLFVAHLKDDTSALQENSLALKADCRHASLQRQNMRDDMTKSDSMMKVLEQRTNDLGKSLKATQAIVDDNSNVCTKMEDNNNKLQSEMVQVASELKAANNLIRMGQEALGKTNSELQSTQGQLSHSCMIWEQTRQELDITKTNVRSLKEAHDLASVRANDLAGQLEATRLMAHDTRRGLMDTNSVVLPNLNLGDMSMVRKPMSARADMMSTHPGSRPLNLKPLPKKVPAQGSTGTVANRRGSPDPANVMDRMAWI